MPSLPALPAKSSSLRDTAATNALYHKATREYLNRSFSAALATLAIFRAQYLSAKSKRKAFLLYIAVLDSTSSLPEDELQQQFGKEGQAIVDRLRRGTIWPEAEAYFENALPKDVTANMLLSLTRHMIDTSKLQQQVEAHLTSLDPDSADYDAVSEVYALHVLPRCNEWDAARGYIESCDFSDEKREQWLAYLEQYRAATDHEKEQLRKAAEEARMAEAEAKKLKKIRKSRREGSKRSATSVNGSSTTGTTILPGAKSGHPRGLEDGEMPPSSNDKAPTDSLTPISTLHRWSNSLTSTLSVTFRPRFLRILLFLVVIFGATGRREIRDRLQSMVGQVGRTIAAGFKVSYI